MNWKFWQKKGGGDSEKAPIKKLAKPSELPNAVGRKMVVGMQLDPDEVWALKYVSRPSDGQAGIHDFRLFHPNEAAQAGLAVKDWYSLDDHPHLILYEGRYGKHDQSVEINTPRLSAA